MKKILLVSNSSGVTCATLDFAAFIARQGKSKLIGLFVDEQAIDLTPAIKSLGGQMYIETITQSNEEYKEHEERLKKVIQSFTDGCTQREIVSHVRQYRNNALEHTITETRYADLLILDPSFSFVNDTSTPSKYATEIFHKAECPVLVAPEVFEVPGEIIIAYDNSSSSVFAIKQFYMQLPTLAGKKVTILHIDNNNEPDINLVKEPNMCIKEWLDLHFGSYSFLTIKGDPKEELFKYLLENNQDNNKLLVIGAFGRNFISSLFRKSAAELVLKTVDIPVFIAHV